MSAFLFDVIRRCPAGECEPGCNCHIATVNVDVDELTDTELRTFEMRGSLAQRTEIEAHLRFQCAGCLQWVPWNLGAADDGPDICDACWARAHQAAE